MLRVLQITDLHLLSHHSERLIGLDTEFYFRQVLADAFAQYDRIDLILATGDLAQHPCPETYERLIQHLLSYDIRTIYIPGNHDDVGLLQSALSRRNIADEKYLDLELWQFIALNSQIPGSPAGRLSSRELEFLKGILDKHPSKSTLIAMHHHCINSGSPWMDRMQIENSRQFLELIARYPQVKIICFGHTHQEFARQQSNQWFFSCPSTCFQFKPGATEFTIDPLAPGYRIFELGKNGQFQTTCHRLASAPSSLKTQSHDY